LEAEVYARVERYLRNLVAVEVECKYRCHVGNQYVRHVPVARDHSMVKRTSAVGISRVDISTCPDKDLCYLNLVALGCNAKRCLIALVMLVNKKTVSLDHRFNFFDVVPLNVSKKFKATLSAVSALGDYVLHIVALFNPVVVNFLRNIL
jgi:hypothetical protein